MFKVFEKLKLLFNNPLKKKYKKEKVLVVPDNELALSVLDGVDIEDYIESEGIFKLRYKMEKNLKYRQVIPYCILKYKDHVFTTKRIDGDSRLVGKHSIGTGGHINPIDIGYFGTTILDNAIEREIDEEVYLESKIVSKRLVDVISMSATEVDSVHLGLVYFIELDGKEVKVKETETLKGKFVHINSLKDYNLENWSQYVYENLLKKEE